MRCIITSSEFFSRVAFRAKVKSPFELVASAMRAMAAPPDTTPRTLVLTAPQMNLVAYSSFLFLPLAVLAAGAAVWWTRR